MSAVGSWTTGSAPRARVRPGDVVQQDRVPSDRVVRSQPILRLRLRGMVPSPAEIGAHGVEHRAKGVEVESVTAGDRQQPTTGPHRRGFRCLVHASLPETALPGR